MWPISKLANYFVTSILMTIAYFLIFGDCFFSPAECAKNGMDDGAIFSIGLVFYPLLLIYLFSFWLILYPVILQLNKNTKNTVAIFLATIVFSIFLCFCFYSKQTDTLLSAFEYIFLPTLLAYLIPALITFKLFRKDIP